MKAIIFDFDGLMIDTESVWYVCFKEVLAVYGLELTLEQFSKGVGTTGSSLYDYLEQNLSHPVPREEIKRAASQLFPVKMGEPLLRDGVKSYLREAKEMGLGIGLASSSSYEWVVGYLKRLEVFDYFDVIKTRNDVKNVKPDPELYRKALEALSVLPHEAIAFEDSFHGLAAAKACGIPCVVVPNNSTAHLDFTGAAYHLTSMSELGLKSVIEIVGACHHPNFVEGSFGKTF